MKKNHILAAFLFLPSLLHAQEVSEPIKEIIRQDYIRVLPTISVFIVALIVFYKFTKVILDHKIKQRLIDKGVSDSVIESFLKPAAANAKNQAIKWFIILVTVSAGLFVVNSSLPLGIHSLAIVIGSLAIGFLTYYFFLKRSEK